MKNQPTNHPNDDDDDDDNDNKQTTTALLLFPTMGLDGGSGCCCKGVEISSPSSKLMTTTTTTSSSTVQDDNHSNNNNNDIGTVVQCYRTTPLHVFRQKLRSSCIQSLLTSRSRGSLASDDNHNDNDNDIFGGSSCSSNGSSSNSSNMGMDVVRYNSQKFESDLSKLDWKTLCEQHDDLAYSATSTASSSSSTTTTIRRKRKRDEQKEEDHHHRQQHQVVSVVAIPSSSLVEIVETICDPTVIPLCCQDNVVVRILLKAIQKSPRARSSASTTRRMRGIATTKTSSTASASSYGNDSVCSSTSGRSFSTSSTTIGGGRWSPSQDLLIRRLQTILVHRPSASGTVIRYFETDTCDFTSMSPNNANRLISVIFCLMNNFTFFNGISNTTNRILDDAAVELTKLDLLSASLALLRRMDDMAIVQEQQHHRRNINCHTSTQQTQEILNLHGFSQNQYETKKRSNNKPAKMTLSFLLDESIEASLPYNSSSIDGGGAVRGRGNEKTSYEWPTVRSRLYKKLIRYMLDERQRMSLPSKANGSDSMVSVPSLVVTDSSILREAVGRPQSPSLRICLVFLAQSTDPGSSRHRHYRYCKISDLCWQGYIASTTRTTTKTTAATEATFQNLSTSSVWLRIYTEWIGDCSFFAENRKSCWDCLHHLVQFLQKVSQNIDDEKDEKESISDSDDVDEAAIKKRNDTVGQLLASIGYILSRRSRMLQNKKKDRIQVEFEKFVQYLSIHFGEDEALFLQLISDEDKKDLIRSTLQRLGIFGLSMADSHSKIGSNEESENYTNVNSANVKFTSYFEALKCWPFANHYSVRSAIQRIDGKVLATMDGLGNVQRLLSSTIEQADSEDTSRWEKKKRKPKSSVPILESLDHKSDIFSHIFSFCGHKKLLMLEQVCKSWRAIIKKDSNSLWRGAYLGQFRAIYHGVDLRCPAPCKEKKLASPSSSDSQSLRPDPTTPGCLNWKSLFERKYMAQKCLWNKRSSKTGFKYRTCPYIGCLCVMKSIDQERKHLLVHERSDEKALDARNKKKTKVKKGTATKAKNSTARKKSSSPKSGNQSTKNRLVTS